VLHLEGEVVQAQREPFGQVAARVQRQVHEAVDEADVLAGGDGPSAPAALQREQPLLDAAAGLGDAEGLGADLDPVRRGGDGGGRRALQLEVALLVREALEDEGPLLLAGGGRGEGPQIEIGGRVPGAPGLVEPVEQLVGRRGRVRGREARAGAGDADGRQRQGA